MTVSSVDVKGAASGVIPFKRARVAGQSGRGPQINGTSAGIAIPHITAILASFNDVQGGNMLVNPIALPPGTTYNQSAYAGGVINTQCLAEYDACTYYAHSAVSLVGNDNHGHVTVQYFPMTQQGPETVFIPENDPAEGEPLGVEEPITPINIDWPLVGSAPSPGELDASWGIYSAAGDQSFSVGGGGVGGSKGFTQKTIQETTFRYAFSTGDWFEVTFHEDWFGNTNAHPEHIAFARLACSTQTGFFTTTSYTVLPFWNLVDQSAWSAASTFGVQVLTTLPPMTLGAVGGGNAQSALIAV